MQAHICYEHRHNASEAPWYTSEQCVIDIWPVFACADAQLAATLQYEHFKSDERENKLEIIPWRSKVDTTMYSAALRIFCFEMILLAAAEIFAPKFSLRVVRGMYVSGMTSLPVAIRLVVLARQHDVYEEYMSYPSRE